MHVMESGRPTRNPRTSGVQVIARAARILRLLRDHPEGASLAWIAREVGLARSTTHRIVAALQAERLVDPLSPTGLLRLGPGLVELASAVRGELRQYVRPYLEQLSRETDETVDLAVLDGDTALFVDQVAAPRRLQAVSAVGSRFPLHCTANGKAILAEVPPDVAKRLLPRRLPALTPSTITSRERLFEELERVRRDGVAFDREEHTPGICAVGTVIRGFAGELAAVTIPLPATRFYGNEERLAAALLDTRRRIEQRLAALDTVRGW
jgi:DNA-binding IclR family transcriptional regulator